MKTAAKSPARQEARVYGDKPIVVNEMAKGRDTLAEFGGEAGANVFHGRVRRETLYRNNEERHPKRKDR